MEDLRLISMSNYLPGEARSLNHTRKLSVSLPKVFSQKSIKEVKGFVFGDLTVKKAQPVVRTRYRLNRTDKVYIAIAAYGFSEALCLRG